MKKSLAIILGMIIPYITPFAYLISAGEKENKTLERKLDLGKPMPSFDSFHSCAERKTPMGQDVRVYCDNLEKEKGFEVHKGEKIIKRAIYWKNPEGETCIYFDGFTGNPDGEIDARFSKEYFSVPDLLDLEN